MVLLAIGEQMGMTPKWIGYCFLVFTILLYAGIGIMSRTLEVAEYYVAGRRVPAFFNGMATGADWMSAASFIGMAGTLYLTGFDGLSFIMGWTGGYVLVALLLAPYLRKFGQFTIPDFLGARYGGNIVRSLGVIAAIIASFTYVVAQIYGVGLITSRFTGLEFGIGVFVGLAGILVCSFLGGMKAVTWTQVAQYVILIIAYMIPVVWLSVKHTGIPIPQLVYGTVLEKVTEREKVLTNDPGEKQVRQIFADRAKAADDKIKGLPAQLPGGEGRRREEARGPEGRHRAQGRPRGRREGRQGLPGRREGRQGQVEGRQGRRRRPHGAAERRTPRPIPARTRRRATLAKWNFIGVVFCMMFGTAALPHILMRYYTTPSVQEARVSVFWSLFFIFLLYFTAPALAVLAKFDVYTLVVGSKFADLPAWVNAWRTVDPTLLNITDINKDGIVQLAEIVIGGDLIVLATPEIAGLPYVISGLVAAGGLAAALSTADGLLLTIANALSHDLYYKMINPNASPGMRITVSKILLLGVAVIAAYVTSLKPGNILFLVGAAFSIAASAFFPALVMGIFWKRASKIGAIAGIVAGLGICLYYMVHTYPVFIQWFGTTPITKWFGLEPISAGMFGVPVGIITIFVVSLVTPAPDKEVQELVDHVRYPNLTGDIDTKGT